MQSPFLKKENRIYLDYAAATPIHKDVFKSMQPFLNEEWANPSAIYKEGMRARKVIENARTSLARTLTVRSENVTFTSGGTESNNLALYGVVDDLIENGTLVEDIEIITTRVEHPSIISVIEDLKKKGVNIRYIPVDTDGLIDIKVFENTLSSNTKLVSFAYVNSETGVIQDIKKITRTVRKWNNIHNANVLVHTDACQAPLWLSCALDTLGVDLMSLDAGKCYGPKGVGVLVCRNNVSLKPYIVGGTQEGGLRAGTESPALVIGCVHAIQRAQKSHEERNEKMSELRNYGMELLRREIPNMVINGSTTSRVANNINISVHDLDSEYAVVVLDAKGVAASTKSACGSLDESGSYVVREMTDDADRVNSTIRFTFGEESTKHDIEKACSILKTHIQNMKAI